LRETGFAQARLINDFSALALAIPLLGPADVHGIGPLAEPQSENPIAVIGPGTGFGAAILMPRGDGAPIVVATEGGHASLAPEGETEIGILRILAREHGHVSLERVLSGAGLCNIHRALAEIDGRNPEEIDAPTITKRALAGEPQHLRTVERFCAMLGAAAGNFALSYGALGGVFVAGGIAPEMLAIIERSEFRRRFEAKGRFEAYLRKIPTKIILHPDMALLGAASLARALTTGRKEEG
jgi:glucokinase